MTIAVAAKFPAPSIAKIAALTGFALLLMASHLFAQEASAPLVELGEAAVAAKSSAATETPDRGNMIAMLQTVATQLEQQKYTETEPYFILPDNFKPAMFERLTKRGVISSDGVKALEIAGKFGSAAELFGEKSAVSYVKDAGVPANDCYGMVMKQGDTDCRVIAWWSGAQFKIVDINRVGRMDPGKATAPQPMKEIQWPIGDEPSRELLLDSLSVLLKELEQKNYAPVSKHLMLPPDFPPAKLERILRINELSEAGIAVLRESGRFGKAAEIFETGRAESLVQRAGATLDECYAIIASKNGQQGETMARWDVNQRQFQFIRVGDIGKLAGEDEASDE